MTRLPDLKWRPAYAYLPGQTERHPETLFDEIKNACAGCHYYEFRETATFDYAYSFLREGFYWESHEVFEVLWMACPDGSAEKTLLQGLIQLANMHLKQRMGRQKAAIRLRAMAEALWTEAFTHQNGALYGFKKEDLEYLMQNNA